MKQVDLEPTDYRASPIKGEKFFASGGLRRLAIKFGFLIFGLIVYFVISGPLLALSDWLWSIWH